MKRSHTVLGIDPGLARLGWAVIRSSGMNVTLIGCGCVETAAAQAPAERLLQLHQRLAHIIADYQPDALAVEKLYFTKNVTTGISVAQARGLVLLSAAMANVPVEEFSPTAVKSTVTGDGRADKRQMGKMIRLLLKLKQLPRHDDTTDAIAVALCGSSMKMVH